MTSKLSIYEFQDPVSFLDATFKNAQLKNPRFSMRSWAKQLGLSNVAMLSLVFSRKRRLLPSLASKISQYFLEREEFTQIEARYFDMLVLFSNALSIEEKKFYQSILSSLRPDQSFSTLELDQMRLIADWWHIAILEMTHLKIFKSDPRWISLRLGESVNEGQVKDAIDRLLRLKLLECSPEGVLKKATKE
jgi:uncharacterized protein (TIGR02147 family)